MRIIVAGSRTITDYNEVQLAINRSGFNISEVVCGMARGVDSLGKKYALNHQIPIAEFPAMWDTYGTQAGFMRNEKMALYADGLILVWDGKSRGSQHMLNIAKKYNLPIHNHIVLGGLTLPGIPAVLDAPLKPYSDNWKN
jgi:hypothetical protein